ncbi:hypothetical protein HK100_007349 [Physocladia obscura]|uniref:Uncharacterized protein n=1 Tax=Physocladia obscura TaxID=109957 RepID=A0AAD5SV33_9FUNG|nr:hypothetical protein HK100_007349 [Physocladia obscura]
MQHGFYIGTSLGEAIIIEFDVCILRNNGGNQQHPSENLDIEIFHRIPCRRRTSLLPITNATAIPFHNAIVSHVAHTASDKFIVAHSIPNLETVWQCKVDVCAGTGRDRVSRRIANYINEFNLTGMEGVGADTVLLTVRQRRNTAASTSVGDVQLEDKVVTNISVDAVHKRVIVAFKAGNVVSITAPFAVTKASHLQTQSFEKQQQPPSSRSSSKISGSIPTLAATLATPPQVPPTRIVGDFNRGGWRGASNNGGRAGIRNVAVAAGALPTPANSHSVSLIGNNNTTAVRAISRTEMLRKGQNMGSEKLLAGGKTSTVFPVVVVADEFGNVDPGEPADVELNSLIDNQEKIDSESGKRSHSQFGGNDNGDFIHCAKGNDLFVSWVLDVSFFKDKQI